MGNRAVVLAVWILALMTVAMGGNAVLSGSLAPPALTDPGSWSAWAGERAPLHAAFAVLGLTVVAMAWYLLVVTVLQVTSRLVGAARLVAVSDVLTVPVVRRSVQAVLGVGLAGSVVAAGTGRLVAPEPGAPAASLALIVATVPVDEEPSGGGSPGGDAEPPVMRRLPDADAEPAEPTVAPAVAAEWTVAAGDHLWSVAARLLEAAWGTEADDDDVAPYWQRLVEANHDRLGDPDNPDLVYPGQRLAVVEPPAPPR